MIVLIAAAALVVIGLACALAFGAFARMSVHAPAPASAVAGRGLPEGPIVSDDIEHVQFDVAVRGYRMDQVDAVLERLRQRLAELEEEQGAPAPFRFDDDPDGWSAFPPISPAPQDRGGAAEVLPFSRTDAPGEEPRR